MSTFLKWWKISLLRCSRCCLITIHHAIFLENHAEIPSNLGCKSPYKTQLKFLIILLSYQVILLVKIIILFDVGNGSMEKGCDVIDKGRVGVCIPGKG